MNPTMSGNELRTINPSYPGESLTELTSGIRILWLLPGQGDETVACELQAVSIYSVAKPYTALSYVWGDQTDVQRIILNGKDYYITRHLESALRNLRYADGRRALWIDQLCINQRSIVERSNQVNLMKRIYTSVEEVAICLQEVAGATHRAKTAFCDHVGISPSIASAQRLTARDFVSLLDLILRADQGQCLLAGEPETDNMITALCKFLSSTWFTRIWTVQELVVNPNVYFIMGCMTFFWEDALFMVQHCKSHMHRKCCCFQHKGYHSKVASIISVMNEVELLERLRYDFENEVKLELEILLNTFRHRQATDPRDKVFGLLGITHPVWLNGSRIEADYDLSAAQVCQMIATASLQNWRGESDLNFFMDITADTARDPVMPSWVPEWTASLNEKDAPTRGSLRLEAGIYNASDGHEKQVEFNKEFPDEVRIRGVLVDQVHEVVQPLRTTDSGDRSPTSLDSMRGEFDRLFDQMKDEKGLSQNREHVYRRLLCMDMNVWVRLEGAIPKTSYSRMLARDYDDISRDHTPARFKAVTPGAADGWYWQPYEAYQSFKLFATNEGRFGMGPLNMQDGDRVCVLLGANMPFVIRPVGDHTDDEIDGIRYQLIGFCYLDGIMDGEVLKHNNIALIAWRTQWITLV